MFHYPCHTAREIALAFDWPYNPEGYLAINRNRKGGALQTLIDELLKLVKSGDTNEQVGATEALGIIPEARTPEVTTTLIQNLPDCAARNYEYGGHYDDEDDMRTPGQVAAEILGNWRIREAVPALCQIISNQLIWPWNRIAAIEALGKIGDPAAIERLKPLLTSTETRRWGVYSEYRTVAIAKLAAEAIAKLTPKKYPEVIGFECFGQRTATNKPPSEIHIVERFITEETETGSEGEIYFAYCGKQEQGWYNTKYCPAPWLGTIEEANSQGLPFCLNCAEKMKVQLTTFCGV